MQWSVETYLRAAVEWAMKVQEIILRAMAKKIIWWHAAEIIGISDRQMQRWRRRNSRAACTHSALRAGGVLTQLSAHNASKLARGIPGIWRVAQAFPAPGKLERIVTRHEVLMCEVIRVAVFRAHSKERLARPCA
jgi:hypothetical protein